MTMINEFMATQRPCVVARLIAAMPDDLATVASEALAGDEHTYTSNRWTTTLARRGFRCSAQSARLHRRRLCTCFSLHHDANTSA